MRTFIHNYRRPLLAVFGVMLMIVFMLPANIQPGGGRSNPIIGHIGKDPVRAAEASTAEVDWEIITRRIAVHNSNAVDPRERWLPLALRHLTAPGFEAISTNRSAYLLLLKEAERSGAAVTPDEVENLLDSPIIGIVDQKGNRVIPYADLDNLDEKERIAAAVGRMLLVQRAFESAFDTIKISDPVRRQVLAEQIQTVDMSVVSIPASQFTPADPTPEQLEEHFKKYADVNPEDLDRSPLGYGYRFPNRVKLQSIELTAGQIRAAAERARTRDDNAQYEWDREAFKYYTANQSLFPTTAPAAATEPSAATRPTTRPFAEARQEARRAVLDNDVAKLTQRIIERISTTITSDYVAYRNAINTGGATPTIPANSVGPAYNTYEYLQALAVQIQQAFDLLPPTRAFDRDFLTAADVSGLPGLGQAYVENEPFVRYVFTRAAAFSAEKDDTRTLQLFEPSPVTRDDVGNAYIFRLTDAQAAHAPASLQEIAAAVEADVRGLSAFQQARKVAEDLVAKARETGSLESAAATANYNLTRLSAVRFTDPAPLAPLHLTSPLAQRSFLRQAADLMASISNDTPRPTGLVELPREGRALVAQITAVQSILTSPTELALFETQAAMHATRLFAGTLVNDWFRYDSVAARLNFTPTADSDLPATPAQPATPRPRQPIL